MNTILYIVMQAIAIFISYFGNDPEYREGEGDVEFTIPAGVN